MKKIICFISLVIGSVYSVCAQANQTEIMRMAISKAIATTYTGDDPHLYQEFLGFNKKVIPYLIDVIDTNKKGYAGYFRPTNSNLKSILNFNGIHAAYLIEFILKNNKMPKSNDITANLMFNRNIIIKRDGSTPLDLSDIKEIKKIYKSWWQVNCNKSIEELRVDWRAGRRPLDGSLYHWF